MAPNVILLSLLLGSLLWPLNCTKSAQGAAPFPDQDLLHQPLSRIELDREPLTNAIAKVNDQVRLGFSIEYELGQTISGPSPPLAKITASIPGTTAAGVLDALVNLDPTFVWSRDENVVNVFPRSVQMEPGYLLNRTVPLIELKEVSDAQQALFAAVAQLPGPKEQIAVFQAGGTIAFPRPWTTTFRGVTMRHVLNAIATQLGPGYGWQFSGAKDFRLVTFHARLLARKSQPQAKQ